MKYCKPKTYNYVGLNGVLTETQYITYADIEQHHGTEFAQQWKHFASTKKEVKFGSEMGYYYYDYKWHALTARMWLDS